jgi:tetratricopeptide (TPR) repeat protein
MFNLFKQKKDPRKLASEAGQTRDPHKAVDLYSDAIKIEKESKNLNKDFLSDLYLKRGEIYLNQGVAILSSSDFLHAIEYNSRNGVAHNDLGIWFTIQHFATPDFSRAIEHLDKAVEYCPDRPDFKMNRAVIKIKMGLKDAGREELERLYNDGYQDAKIAIERFCK